MDDLVFASVVSWPVSIGVVFDLDVCSVWSVVECICVEVESPVCSDFAWGVSPCCASLLV